MIRSSGRSRRHAKALRGIKSAPGFIHASPRTGIIAIRGDQVHTVADADLLQQLPNGYWLSNLAWQQAESLSGRADLRCVHQDGWVGMTTAEIMNEWSRSQGAAQGEALELSRCLKRVVELADSLALRLRHGADWSDCWMDHLTSVLSGNNLADGFELAALEDSGCGKWFQPKVGSCGGDLQSVGLFGTRTSSFGKGKRGTTVVSLPALSYLRQLAGQSVPQAGPWKAQSPEGVDEEMRSGHVDRLEAMGLPVIVIGKFVAREPLPPSWLNSWLSGGCKLFGRRCFTLEEIRVLIEHGRFQLEAAMVGSGWIEPVEESLLGKCISHLLDSCGGKLVAENSWSANLAALMLVKAVLDGNQTSSGRLSMEVAWLAARDRIAMLPALRLLESMGVELVSAVAGRIRYVVPNDLPTRARLETGLWKIGIAVPADFVAGNWSRQQGQVCSLADFGGDDECMPLAVAVRLGLTEALWQFDALLDERVCDREAGFHVCMERMLGDGQ